jgi:hypothetical protein
MGVLITLDMSKAYLSFIMGDHGSYSKEPLPKKRLLKQLKTNGNPRTLKSLSGGALNFIDNKTHSYFLILGKEIRFLFAWIALLLQKFNLFALVMYSQLQFSVEVMMQWYECGIFFFHKKCVANFNFLTLWTRSSEEWEFVMGMIVMSFVQKTCVEDVAVASWCKTVV